MEVSKSSYGFRQEPTELDVLQFLNGTVPLRIRILSVREGAPGTNSKTFGVDDFEGRL